MHDQQSILIVCVNYGSYDEAARYVGSISTAGKERVRISVVLVDNTQDDNGKVLSEFLDQEAVDFLYVKTPQNIGYFGGASYGLKVYLEKNDLPDWVIVSNVDLVVEDPSIFDSLAEIDFPDRVGIIAPAIWSNDWQTDRNPYMASRPKKRTIHLYVHLYSNYLFLNLYRILSNLKSLARRKIGTDVLPFLNLLLKSVGASNDSMTENSCGDMSCIYAPHGSFIIFSKQYFRSGGHIDFPCFLFMEEIYVAEIARRLNLKVVYAPMLKVIHDAHVSTGLLRSPLMARYMYESAVYISDEFFS